MPVAIDFVEATRVLEAAAARARSAEPVSASGESVFALWQERTERLAGMRKNKVAIAALGAALLAKATAPQIDPLSLVERSGERGYSARAVAQLLASRQRDLAYRLGTKAPDPLAASPWFGPARISDIDKWHDESLPFADELISWLAALEHAEAADALTGFLRARMAVAAEQATQLKLPTVAGQEVHLDDLVGTTRNFIERNPEDGRRGTAAVAAAFAAAGHQVVARPVNDPSQIDIDVLTAEGTPVLGIEIKQKPTSPSDADDIAAGVAAAGGDHALLCALALGQPRLDDAGLQARADHEHRVVLQIVYSIGEVIRIALFSSAVSRSDFVAAYPHELAKFLDALEVSQDGRVQWQGLAQGWASD